MLFVSFVVAFIKVVNIASFVAASPSNCAGVDEDLCAFFRTELAGFTTAERRQETSAGWELIGINSKINA